MTKLPSPFAKIIITQALHGKEQGFQALDIARTYRDFICPIDGLEVYSRSGIGTDTEAFNIRLPDKDKTIIQCVHATPKRKGTFQKGEVIGTLIDYKKNGIADDHWHIAVKYKNKWYPFLSIIDTETELDVSRDEKGKPRLNLKWASFDTYPNLELELPNQPKPSNYMSENETKLTNELLTNNIGISSPQPIIKAINNKKYFEAFQTLINGNTAKKVEVNELKEKELELNNEIQRLNEALIARRKIIEELQEKVKELEQTKIELKDITDIAFSEAKSSKKKLEDNTEFSFNKFAVGLSKSGVFNAIISVFATSVAYLISTNVPELSPYAPELTILIGSIFGVTVASQSGANIIKAKK